MRDMENRRKYQNNYYKTRSANDEEFVKKHRQNIRKSKDKAVARAKEYIAQWRSNGCKLCPEKEVCCLSAHHINSDLKTMNVGNMVGQGVSLNRIKAELENCICLCENCHRKVHAGIIKL